MEENQPTRVDSENSRPLGVWKTGLLLVGSALFGGLAVAFWHRRTLADIRQAAGQEPTSHRSQGSEDDVIY